jgi:chitodextrinase
MKSLLASVQGSRRAPLRSLLTISLIAGMCLISQASSPVASAAGAGLTISGNTFLLDGQPFVPQGFNSIAALNSTWCTSPSTQKAADNFGSAELEDAQSMWNANTLRFQVSQPVLAGPNGAAYAAQVQNYANTALLDGFVVDISMQDQSLACGPSEPLPSQETESAWTELIDNTTLSSDPDVMFELFNEPQNSPVTAATNNLNQETWVDWEDGGRGIVPTSQQTWSAYVPIGFQDLVDYMRVTLDVPNVLVADGANKAATLAGVPILNDPGTSYDIAYAVHPYMFTDGESGWNTRFGQVAATNAVIATEWNFPGSGCGSAQGTTAPEFLSYMKYTLHVGVLGQALDVFSDELMADSSLDPTQCGTASPGSGYDFLYDYLEPDTQAPSVPTGLTATAMSPSEISLSWSPSTDNVEVAGYQVFSISGGSATPVGTVTNGTSYLATGLSDATSYTFAVDAFDPAGNASQLSAQASATTPSETPTVPGNLILTSGAGGVDLSWSASTDSVGVAGYTIYRDGTVIATTPQLTYSDTTVQQGSTYTYAVAAYDADGNSSALSAGESITYPDTTAPSKPLGLKLTAGVKTITLRWDASTDNVGVAGYDLYRGSALIAKVGGATLTYDDRGLRPWTRYSFHIVAFDAAGNLSAPSATVSAIAK